MINQTQTISNSYDLMTRLVYGYK